MSLAEDVIKKMAGRTVTLSTCESLTGGGIGAALTSVPGASAVFRGALVTYARELKASLAGVDEELIANEGVVNELTALQMAQIFAAGGIEVAREQLQAVDGAIAAAGGTQGLTFGESGRPD